MAEKVTTMVIRVDLGCEKCRKKIKKVLCKIPQIQNQTYDEKSNTVTITVVGRCPEKVKDKICSKARNIILCGVEIKETPKPEPKPKPVPPKPDPPKPDPPKPDPPKTDPCYRVCYEAYGCGPCYPCMPPPCYYPCYGRPVYDSWGGGGCRIM